MIAKGIFKSSLSVHQLINSCKASASLINFYIDTFRDTVTYTFKDKSRIEIGKNGYCVMYKGWHKGSGVRKWLTLH